MRSSLYLLALFLLLSSAACGGSSGGPPTMMQPALTATFVESGQAPTADMARMTGQAAGTTVVLSVVLGGPSTSNDIYSFAFDLLISNPTVVEYQAGSATAGTVLVAGGGQQIEALATQTGDRVTVGVAKLGGGPGNSIGGGEEVVVDLTFRVLRAQMTNIRFTPAPGGAPPAALDSSGTIIGSVTFDAASATIGGM